MSTSGRDSLAGRFALATAERPLMGTFNEYTRVALAPTRAGTGVLLTVKWIGMAPYRITVADVDEAVRKLRIMSMPGSSISWS
jgi:hypothetical protein